MRGSLCVLLRDHRQVLRRLPSGGVRGIAIKTFSNFSNFLILRKDFKVAMIVSSDKE